MKRDRPQEPPVPAERHDTIRHGIVALLSQGSWTARDISQSVHIPEKDAYDHLEHVRRSFEKADRHLIVLPAECTKCGFVFRKRERLRKPGKCPICKGEQISPPVFTLKEP